MSGRRHDLLDLLGFGGACVFLACLYLSPADLWPVTAPLRPAMLAAAAMCAAVLARRVMRGEPLRPGDGTGVAVALLFALLFLSPLWSVVPGTSLAYALDAVKLAAAFAGLAGTVRTPAQARRALAVCALASIVPAAVTLQRWHDGVGLVEGFRASYLGLMANPNQLASVMAMTAPLALASWRGAGPLLRGALAASLGLQGAALVATHSRGGLLGFGAGLLASALLSRRPLRGLALACGAGALLLTVAPESFLAREATIGDYAQDASALGRLHAWENGLRALADSPLLGVGAGGYIASWDVYTSRNPKERAYASHNMWMQVSVELGLLGALAFAAALACAARGLWRARRGPLADPARGLLAALAALTVCGQTAGNAFNWFLYLVLGLAGAVASQARAPSREPHGVRLAAA